MASVSCEEKHPAPSISIEPTSISVPGEGGTYQVSITSNSTWKHNVKDRVELDLFVLNEGSFETYYGTKRVYTLVDSDNNVYVWFTTSYLAYRHPECGDYDVFANTGDTVHVKATVKEHTEFRGVKQTVLTRCHVLDVKKYNKVA